MKHVVLLFLMYNFLIAYSQDSRCDNFIIVSGFAEMEIFPNKITLTMSINETENPKKESAIVAMENNIIKFLSHLGISKNNFVIEKYYTLAGSDLFSRYKVNKIYKLVVENMALIDTIVVACMKYGMDNINIQKTEHTSNDSIQLVLLEKALLIAKQKAEIIAKTLNINLGKVVSVNETGNFLVDNRNNAYLMENSDAGFVRMAKVHSSSNLNVDKLYFSKSILVKYEIKSNMP